MKQQEQNTPEKEEINQHDNSEQTQQNMGQPDSNTTQNEEEALGDIAEKRDEMAQSQTGFTGD